MTDSELIDRIERIRAQNNTHWMDLVRLAVRLDPVAAKNILKKIADGDAQVRAYTSLLAEHHRV